MTVRELVRLLNTHPLDLEVLIDVEGAFCTIDDVYAERIASMFNAPGSPVILISDSPRSS